jgi:riboflavin kinase / FMN adenylyltransferase
VRLIRSLAEWTHACQSGALRGGAVTIGNFDGVHRGHARIVELLVQTARAAGGPAIVLSFDPHPARLLRPHAAPIPLTWTERKAALLADLGVDVLVAYPTDRALLELTPQEFFERIIHDQLDARTVVEGLNFRFGRDRVGTIELLDQMCRQTGIRLVPVEPVVVDGQVVSSSRVRQLIAEGSIEAANELLTRPYRIRGTVAAGAGRGAQLGFPTANLDEIDTLLPAEGVYAGWGAQWPAAINLGPNPTFGEMARKVEVHLIGCDASLYGQTLEVDFYARLRDIRPFASVEGLREQLAADVAEARRIAAPRKATGD